MTRNNKGLLVSFEGIDRCGKSTQSDLLQKRLADENVDVEVFREPGSTGVSEQIRRILLSVENADMDPRCELMLYSAARAQLVSEKIIPALEAGKIVILDRYHHSTTAYQGYGRELPIPLIQSVTEFVARGLNPDLAFFLDISPEDAMLRRDKAGRDRLERASMEFFNRVHQGYLEMAKDDPRLIVLDGNLSVDELEAQIWEKVSQLLSK